METRTINYKSYVIHTENGTEHGVFFRGPIQKVSYDAYYDARKTQNAWDYSAKLKNPIRKILEILLGNKHIVDNIAKWEEEMDWAGFTANKLCVPVYFKRDYRTLTAHAQDPSLNIQTVKSHGYESQYELCSGGCVVEKTIIKTKAGKSIRVKIHEKYQYTYEHLFREMADSQQVQT